MDAILLIARLALAAVFVLAGVGKLLDLKGSQEAVKNFGVPESLARPAGLALPIVELAIAALLIPASTALYGAIAAFLLMLLFIGGISFNLARGNQPDCHCFGQLHSEPAGPRTLVRNGIFAAVALFIIVFGWSDAGASTIGWSNTMSGFDWLVLILGVFLIAAVIAEGWLILHMLGQNGRLLLRLDELDEQINLVATGQQIPAPAAPKPVKEAPVRGLPVGTPAPAFKLEGIYGETMTLDALRAPGKPVMLVFSDPGCGPCSAFMPELGSLQKEHAAELSIAVISRGSAEANQEKAGKAGLSPVLLQKNREVSEDYKALGTPSAVIVNADGSIVSPVAGGADSIRDLLKSRTKSGAAAPVVAQAAAPPRINAQPAAAANGGSKPAEAQAPRPRMDEAAPGFTLKNLDGKNVRLADFRGQEAVLIFWSPTCGYCKRMADDIKAWEAAPQAGAPKAVIITSGDVKANRDFGFASTVLMDPATDTMKSYGTGGTPTAILIDANGNIGSQMRVGQPGVMSLLRGEEAPAAPPPAPAPKAVKIGDPAPEVKLNDLSGKPFELSSLKGEKALVVFWNPGCGFCKRMTEDLKQWEAIRPSDAPNIVLVSSGTVEANAEQGISSTVLIDQGFTVGRSFGASGTPSAVLIDENGRIASDVAVGSPKVLALAGAPQTV